MRTYIGRSGDLYRFVAPLYKKGTTGIREGAIQAVQECLHTLPSNKNIAP